MLLADAVPCDRALRLTFLLIAELVVGARLARLIVVAAAALRRAARLLASALVLVGIAAPARSNMPRRQTVATRGPPPCDLLPGFYRQSGNAGQSVFHSNVPGFRWNSNPQNVWLPGRQGVGYGFGTWPPGCRLRFAAVMWNLVHISSG